jgi:L-fuculose-phosphate aldolase
MAVSTAGALDRPVKQQLIDAILMLEQAGSIDHSGHGSIRRDEASFYINSGASARSALTVEDIVTVDLDGNLLEGSARPPLEFHIHSEIYRARSDVNAVLHTHSRWSTLLTIVGVSYKPVYAQGVLLGELPVMESPLSVNTKSMGERVATTLAEARAVLLKAHGAVIVAADIVECFALAIYLEENAHRQYLAMQIGEPYVFTDEERDACRRNLTSPALFRKAWDHYRFKLREMRGI